MSVLIETDKSTSTVWAFGWTWEVEYAIYKYRKDGEWKELGEVTWRTAAPMENGYMISHDDVNGRFQVIEIVKANDYRIIGETGSPLEAMRLARIDHRAVLARAEGI